MDCTECGAAISEDASYCTSCGAEVQATARTGPAPAPQVGREEIPSDAVGVKISCPYCGERPVESVARAHRVTGLVLWVRWDRFSVLGCHRCIRNELLKAAGKNFLVGWWGITAFFINLFAAPYCLVRSFVKRGVNEHLVEALHETGVPWEYLQEGEDFDPARHSFARFNAQALVQLGVALMDAGRLNTGVEEDVIVDSLSEGFGLPPQETRGMIDRAREAPQPLAVVAEGLDGLLDDEGKEAAIVFGLSVAAADGEIEDEELAILGELYEHMDVTDQQVDSALEQLGLA